MREVNVDGAAHVAAAAALHGARLIHLSTDFVFDGELARPVPRGRPTRAGQRVRRLQAGRRACRAGDARRCAGGTHLTDLRRRGAGTDRADGAGRAGRPRGRGLLRGRAALAGGPRRPGSRAAGAGGAAAARRAAPGRPGTRVAARVRAADRGPPRRRPGPAARRPQRRPGGATTARLRARLVPRLPDAANPGAGGACGAHLAATALRSRLCSRGHRRAHPVSCTRARRHGADVRARRADHPGAAVAGGRDGRPGASHRVRPGLSALADLRGQQLRAQHRLPLGDRVLKPRDLGHRHGRGRDHGGDRVSHCRGCSERWRGGRLRRRPAPWRRCRWARSRLPSTSTRCW